MIGVIGDDRRPPGLERGEDFRLGVGDRLDRAQIFDMRGRDCRDQRDMRAHRARQNGDFAAMVHAQLEHRERRVAGHAREAQGHAGVIVIAFDRAVDLARAGAVERREQGFLDARLADRSGDCDDRRGHPLARRQAKRLKRRERISDMDIRAARGP